MGYIGYKKTYLRYSKAKCAEKQTGLVRLQPAKPAM
jgi:hypothetical protein